MTTVEVDGSPQKQVLLKVTVNGISGASVVSARLRLYCTDSSSFGGNVHLAPTTWAESAVTCARRPQPTLPW